MRRMPGSLSSFPVRFTCAGLPPRASTQSMMAWWSVVRFALAMLSFLRRHSGGLWTDARAVRPATEGAAAGGGCGESWYDASVNSYVAVILHLQIPCCRGCLIAAMRLVIFGLTVS